MLLWVLKVCSTSSICQKLVLIRKSFILYIVQQGHHELFSKLWDQIPWIQLLTWLYSSWIQVSTEIILFHVFEQWIYASFFHNLFSLFSKRFFHLRAPFSASFINISWREFFCSGILVKLRSESAFSSFLFSLLFL